MICPPISSPNTRLPSAAVLEASGLTADEALDCGFLSQISEPGEIDDALVKLCQRLSALAPVTQNVTKEGLRRLVVHDLPQGEDLIRRSYGSSDFREGVDAFVAKRSPVWTGS